MKRIAFLNMGFGPYFVPKLYELHKRLSNDACDMQVVEASRSAGLYSYLRSETDLPDWWKCLGGGENPGEGYSGQLQDMFISELERIAPDMVFAGAVAYTAGSAAVKWGLRHGRPVVIMDNARRRNVSRGMVKNLMKRCFHLNADAAFVPSVLWKDDYEWWGFEERRLFYGHNALDNSQWLAWSKELKIRADDVKRQNHLPDRYFLGVGRHIPAKNWIKLMEAYNQYVCTSDGVAWGLVLVGSGPTRSDLETLVAERGLTGVVFRDFLPPDKLAEYYSQCSALILPSLNETWGCVVNECMCFSKPVLVSNLCGCAGDLVSQGENGYSFDPNNADEMAFRMKEMSAMGADDLERMGQKSSEIISRWDIDRFEKGVRDAITFCEKEPKRYGPGWTRMLLPLWKGRYNPV